MLLERHSVIIKKFVIAAAVVLASTCAYGQDSPDSGPAPEPDISYIPFGNLGNASAADIERAKQLGASVASDLLYAYQTRKTPEMEQFATQVRRRADDMADPKLAAERDKVLDFLGLDPEADTALYYFVSWSMPMEMLRSYVIEAMWSGGTVVFKGVPPGKTLGKFILEDLKDLVYAKGASANISIDPRLFDAYEVTTVPTVVFTTVRGNMQCQGVNPVEFTHNKQTLSFDTCPPLDPASFMKVSGAVTASYALQMFIDEGLPQAKPYLAALARGFAEGRVPGKDQKPFAGEWADVLAPNPPDAAKAAPPQ